MDELINEDQLINLIRIIDAKKISIISITTLCKVDKLLDLSVKQYNLLLVVMGECR